MTVRLFYVDESYDARRFCLTAIGIPHLEWRECLRRVRQHCQRLKAQYGLYLRKEIHAHEFVSGRGHYSPQTIGKYQRSRIFEDLLRTVASLPEVMVINVCLPAAGRDDVEMAAWDRLVNRIERTMLAFEAREGAIRSKLLSAIPADALSGPYRASLARRLSAYRPRAMIFADEGREREITKALRKMSAFNPVPSHFGAWSGGKATHNIPIQRTIEDPVFKKSHHSYFVQLADCVAFALLKREVTPTPNIRRYGIDKMFERTMSKVCFVAASPRDPLGIVRN